MLNPDYGQDLSGMPSPGPSSYGRVRAEQLAEADRLEDESRKCAATNPKQSAKLHFKALDIKRGYSS